MERVEGVVEEHEAVVMGGGISGIGAVIRLERDAGIEDVVLLERSNGLGGTWLENTYPGCACDVPSSFYSYEFAPNPEWDRVFAEQRQILEYCQRVARDFGVEEKARLGVEVLSAAWDEEAGRWEIETSAGRFRTPLFVFAPGGLHEPSIPDLAGLDRFEGTQFHTARWNHHHDLRGRRVAVVGTGASSVQLVPHVADQAGHLTLVQRTPTWLWPKPDWRTTRLEKWLYRRFPATQRAQRRLVFRGSDLLLRAYGRVEVARPFNVIGRAHLRAVVKDRELRKALTPDWVFGCKRITFSNRFYQALQRPNVTLAPYGLQEVRERSIITSDGTEHEVDTIIWATGFHVSDPPFAGHIRGRDGRTLAEHWNGNPRAYLGASIAGFPNAFMLFGPNSGTACCTLQLEAQLNYVTRVVREQRERGLATLDIHPEVVAEFKRTNTQRLARSTWQAGGCQAFYMDATGDNYLIYGGTMQEMLDQSHEFDIAWFATTSELDTDGDLAGKA